jgi:hypothetical protein
VSLRLTETLLAPQAGARLREVDGLADDLWELALRIHANPE